MRSVFGLVVGLPVALALHYAFDIQNDYAGVALGFGCFFIARGVSHLLWDD